MIRFRKVAILFAIGSTIYWQAVTALLSVINPIAGVDAAPYWLTALANVIPALLYAVFALWFCHRLARSVLKQAGHR